ncbi:MAG: acyl-CoA thioesterase, partial [Candidatus Poriferisodalaceae bacterium]
MTQVFENLLKFKRLSADTYLAPSAPEGGQRTFGGQFL